MPMWALLRADDCPLCEDLDRRSECQPLTDCRSRTPDDVVRYLPIRSKQRRKNAPATTWLAYGNVSNCPGSGPRL
jgi:hypothetical protein